MAPHGTPGDEADVDPRSLPDDGLGQGPRTTDAPQPDHHEDPEESDRDSTPEQNETDGADEESTPEEDR